MYFQIDVHSLNKLIILLKGSGTIYLQFKKIKGININFADKNNT